MAKTVRDAKLETRTAREQLKPRDKPYYRAIDEGLHLGYRRHNIGGMWVMRRHIKDAGHRVERIGKADDRMDADGETVLSFAQAQALARRLCVERNRVEVGLPARPAGPYTVKDCLDEYVIYLGEEAKAGVDARWRADALIVPALGKIECSKLTTKQISDWLTALAEQKPRVRTKKKEKQRFRAIKEDEDPAEASRRRHASANRVLTIIKAALNRAWRDKKIPFDSAWRAVKPFRQADAARVRYLSVTEAKGLINGADADFRRLVQAALMTGARFGELAALEVADFNPDSGTVHIRKSKNGKARHVVLTEEGVKFFKQASAGRAPRERMFPKSDGKRWGNNHQVRPMAAACAAAHIEPPANFHCLRHTYASHTVMNGAPLMVVAKNLGHADTRMVEKYYGHLSPSFVADAIRAAAPQFGYKIDEKEAAL